MRRSLILFILCIVWAFASAQTMPNWIKHRPLAENNSFYYRVTIGEGTTYNLAYSNAFAKAILESSWKLGVQVTTTDDIETIKNDIHDNITIGKVDSNIPINKVCEYLEKISTTKFRLYCLWQIGMPGKPVFFEEFGNCE